MTTGQNDHLFDQMGEKRNIIALLVILLIVFCICSATVRGIFSNWIDGVEDTTEAIGEFFDAMSHKRINPVVRMMSAEGKQNYPEEALKEIVNGDDFVLFEGYQSFDILSRSNTTIARSKYKEIRGTVTYENDFIGEFVFYFHKEYGKWKIADFEITIPTEKLQAYQQAVKMGGQK